MLVIPAPVAIKCFCVFESFAAKLAIQEALLEEQEVKHASCFLEG